VAGRVEVEGAARLAKTLGRARNDLGNMREANTRTAALIAGGARLRAPRKTGRLAAAITPRATETEAVVEVGGAAIAYAGVIHNGWPAHGIEPHPFLTDAAKATESQWLPGYERQAQRDLNRVRGA
jgi:hypothetical protein